MTNDEWWAGDCALFIEQAGSVSETDRDAKNRGVGIMCPA
jgi:hypothetical protein